MDGVSEELVALVRKYKYIHLPSQLVLMKQVLVQYYDFLTIVMTIMYVLKREKATVAVACFSDMAYY